MTPEPTDFSDDAIRAAMERHAREVAAANEARDSFLRAAMDKDRGGRNVTDVSRASGLSRPALYLIQDPEKREAANARRRKKPDQGSAE